MPTRGMESSPTVARDTRALSPRAAPGAAHGGDGGCPSGPPVPHPASPSEHLFAGIGEAQDDQKYLSLPNTVLKLVRGACPCCYTTKHSYKMKKEERIK